MSNVVRLKLSISNVGDGRFQLCFSPDGTTKFEGSDSQGVAAIDNDIPFGVGKLVKSVMELHPEIFNKLGE